MTDKKENTEFGVDYSMVLEYLMEQYDQYSDANLYEPSCIPPSCIPCVIPSANIYYKSENLQLESKNQESITTNSIVNKNLPLQFTSATTINSLEKTTLDNIEHNFPKQSNYKIKKLGLLY